MAGTRARNALIALSLFTFLSAPLRAQPLGGRGAVVGTVVGHASGAPVPAAAVEIASVADSTVLARALTDARGQFRIGAVPAGTFYLRLTNVGYAATTTQAFELTYGETRDLGRLRLPVAAITIEPIEVSGERNAVTFEADRTSYNLGVMGMEGATASESLQAIPELDVDIDGRITLRGNAPAIYINGRPSPMTGEALATFLEQFPADYLERIEVLENPSARYDAEGSGGIVNLVMKEGVELGISGSVFANAGTRGQYGVGGRGTLQRGELTLSGGGFARLSDSDNTSHDLRQNLLVDPAFLRRDTWSDRDGVSTNLDIAARHQRTERTRLSARARVSGAGSDMVGATTTTHLDRFEAPLLIYDRASEAASRNVAVDLSTGFEHSWEPRRHELEVELRYRAGRQRADRREETTTDEAIADGVLIPAELTVDRERATDRALRLDVDYTRPFGAGTRLEAGFRSELDERDNDRLIRSIDDPLGFPDGDVDRRGIAQREISNSAYTTLRRGFGRLNVQLGMRAEYLDVHFDVPTGASFGRAYIDFFPSANVSYRFDGGRQLRLSYSRRTSRPGASVLNPVNTSTDPAVERVGNPDIDARFTHSVTMNASRSGALGNLRLSPYYQRTVNDWTRITAVDHRGVSVRTYQNVASETSYGAALTYSLRQRGGWGGNVSVSGRQTHRDASNLDARYSGSSFRWSSRANLNARVTAALTAQSTLSYSPPADLPQGRSAARYRADMGLRYRFLDNRASVRLSLQDPFGVRRTSSVLHDVSYIQIGRSRQSTRGARLNVSYALGGGGRVRGGR